MTKHGSLRLITVLLVLLLALSAAVIGVLYQRNRNLMSANNILSFVAKQRRRSVIDE
jgi:hypothetical protein